MNSNNKARDDLETLLPWHAAGTLDADEARKSSARSPPTRSWPAASRWCARSSPRPSFSTSRSARRRRGRWRRCFRAIDQDRKVVRRAATSPSLGARVAEFFSPRILAWSAAAAVVIVVLQAGVITRMDAAGAGGATSTETATYRTRRPRSRAASSSTPMRWSGSSRRRRSRTSTSSSTIRCGDRRRAQGRRRLSRTGRSRRPLAAAACPRGERARGGQVDRQFRRAERIILPKPIFPASITSSPPGGLCASAGEPARKIGGAVRARGGIASPSVGLVTHPSR